MASSLKNSNLTRQTGTTAETVISTAPALVMAILPNATTTGTVTLRSASTASGSAALHVAAIGLTQQGAQFGPFGVLFPDGLTVQLSAAGDAVGIVWMPAL